jgi:ABC-type dipeptide/oligopeptide/nickel transport system ATPase component
MCKGKIVEFGNSSEVFSNPSHPYTKSLLECAQI